MLRFATASGWQGRNFTRARPATPPAARPCERIRARVYTGRMTHRGLILFLAFTTWALGSCGGDPGKRPTAGPLCPTNCKNCNPEKGCMDCDPGKTFCDMDSVRLCNMDGSIGPVQKICDSMSNEKCSAGNCLTACDTAAASHAYIGCDYWPVTLLNAELDSQFDFAVAVANPLTVGDVVTNGPARVKVVQGGQPCDPNGDLSDGVAYATVSPGQVKTLLLPWVQELSQNGMLPSSVQSSEGAYHLCSSLPVTVYQFNPLQFEKNLTKCSSPNDRPPLCHSYTNDASILLPSSVLQREYIVASRGSFGLQIAPTPQNKNPAAQTTPGFFAVVATQANTHVTVTYSAYASAGINLDEQKPGDKVTYDLALGDVLEIVSKRPKWDPKNPKPPCQNITTDGQGTYCDLGKDYDLTGTSIVADKPIAVFGGHSCAFVPYNKWACDHLEEQIIPLDTWGKQTLAVQTPPAVMGEKNMFRIIAGSNMTTVTLDPPLQKPTMMMAGEWFDVTLAGGLNVTATTMDTSQPRVLVEQFMVGENATIQFNFDGVGDPSMGIAVPIEQWRKNYDFLTPETYTKSHVTVIGRAGMSYKIDGNDMMLGHNVLIGATDYAYEWIPLPAGAHHISSDEPFGINVSGLAAFTSYLYPGGLNLFELLPQ